MRSALAYGVRLDVDFEWPWAPVPPASLPTTLRVHLGHLGSFAGCSEADYAPYAVRAGMRSADAPIVRIDRAADGHFRVRYADGAVFIIGSTLADVYGTSSSGLSLDDLLVYLQGPVFGFLLRLRGVICLHASAAVVDGRAFAVVGAAGMGKSTSAAAFARLGKPVLTDDVLALEDATDRFWAQPGLPRVMLWPPSVAALWGDSEALPLVVNGWTKRYLSLDQPGYRFARERAKLAAIYVLAGRSTEREFAEIAPSSGNEALVSLVANTYANDFLDTAQRAHELEVLGRIASHVSVRRVYAPDDRNAIVPVCEAILADFARLGER